MQNYMTCAKITGVYFKHFYWHLNKDYSYYCYHFRYRNDLIVIVIIIKTLPRQIFLELVMLWLCERKL